MVTRRAYGVISCPPVNLGLQVLYLYYVGKLGSNPFRYGLVA